jgi:hypothetical protein
MTLLVWTKMLPSLPRSCNTFLSEAVLVQTIVYSPAEKLFSPTLKAKGMFAVICWAPSAQWSADSKSIMYTVNNNNVTNIWSQPFEGGPAKQITEFKDSLMTGFAWSRDGKTLATTRGTLVRDAVLITHEK